MTYLLGLAWLLLVFICAFPPPKLAAMVTNWKYDTQLWVEQRVSRHPTLWRFWNPTVTA